MRDWQRAIIAQLVDDVDADYKMSDGAYKYADQARLAAQLLQLLDDQDRPKPFTIREHDGGHVIVWNCTDEPPPVRWTWHCTLPVGHEGDHRWVDSRKTAQFSDGCRALRATSGT